MRGIEELRKARGLSRQELAIKAGVDNATIWRIETGRTQGSVPVLRAIAQALEVPFADLVSQEASA